MDDSVRIINLGSLIFFHSSPECPFGSQILLFQVLMSNHSKTSSIPWEGERYNGSTLKYGDYYYSIKKAIDDQDNRQRIELDNIGTKNKWSDEKMNTELNERVIYRKVQKGSLVSKDKDKSSLAVARIAIAENDIRGLIKKSLTTTAFSQAFPK